MNLINKILISLAVFITLYVIVKSLTRAKKEDIDNLIKQALKSGNTEIGSSERDYKALKKMSKTDVLRLTEIFKKPQNRLTETESQDKAKLILKYQSKIV